MNEDLTIFERKIFREWTDKARAKNTKKHKNTKKTAIQNLFGDSVGVLHEDYILESPKKIKTKQHLEYIIWKLRGGISP